MAPRAQTVASFPFTQSQGACIGVGGSINTKETNFSSHPGSCGQSDSQGGIVRTNRSETGRPDAPGGNEKKKSMTELAKMAV